MPPGMTLSTESNINPKDHKMWPPKSQCKQTNKYIVEEINISSLQILWSIFLLDGNRIFGLLHSTGFCFWWGKGTYPAVLWVNSWLCAWPFRDHMEYGDQIWVDLVQGKCPSCCCTITLAHPYCFTICEKSYSLSEDKNSYNANGIW